MLARLLRAVGGLGALASIRARSTQALVVLAYHRVLPTVHESEYPYDLELISADVEHFDWQMAWLSRNFNVVPVSAIAESMQSGRSLPAGSVAVTFDDGFVDNYSHAFPVLRSRRIPACIFLSTDFVGTTEPYWFEAVAQVLMSAPVGTLRLPAVRSPLPSGATREVRREDIRQLLTVLKRLPDAERRTNMEALQRQAGNLIDATLGFGAHALNWPQVREMSRDGIEFGSHGTSHAVLSQLSGPALARELSGSRKAIEDATGKPVVAIAYPVGGKDAVNDRVIEAAASAGYRLGFSYLPGSNLTRSPDRMLLKRQHVERSIGQSYFQGLLVLPSVFH